MGFAVKSRLGRGRTVETFAATLEVEGDRFDVVVKRPRTELRNDDAFADALVEWGERQQRVEHENVVAVLEAGRTDDGPYVLQESVEGASLTAMIQALRKRKRTLMPGLALSIAEQMAAGLAYLHEGRVVHAGLDPGEVLVSYAGEVKIGDQGLRMLDHHLQGEPSPAADPYQAPELRDPTGATQASDVYALGLLTLEMLIGTAIWTAEQMTVAGSVAALKDFSHVGQAQPSLTEDLVRFLESCLADRPSERCSAGEAQDQIEQILSKHRIREEPGALGEFVKALIPPPEAAEAPTMMVDAEMAERIAAQHSARQAHFEVKSVPLDPDLERKALTRAIRVPSAPRPSVSRTPARIVPNVAKVAVKAASEFDADSRRIVKLAGAGVAALLVLVIALVVLGRDAPRNIRLRVSSVPAGATVYVDGAPVGVTPVDQEVEVKAATVRLRFVLDGHREHQVTIGTDATELRYEAPLERTN